MELKINAFLTEIYLWTIDLEEACIKSFLQISWRKIIFFI
jgi:hypothetical protein